MSRNPTPLAIPAAALLSVLAACSVEPAPSMATDAPLRAEDVHMEMKTPAGILSVGGSEMIMDERSGSVTISGDAFIELKGPTPLAATADRIRVDETGATVDMDGNVKARFAVPDHGKEPGDGGS